jgi:hypothetical protein
VTGIAQGLYSQYLVSVLSEKVGSGTSGGAAGQERQTQSNSDLVVQVGNSFSVDPAVIPFSLEEAWRAPRRRAQ